MDDREALDEIYTMAEEISGSIVLDFHGINSTWKERLDDMQKKLDRIIDLASTEAD